MIKRLIAFVVLVVSVISLYKIFTYEQLNNIEVQVQSTKVLTEILACPVHSGSCFVKQIAGAHNYTVGDKVTVQTDRMAYDMWYLIGKIFLFMLFAIAFRLSIPLVMTGKIQ